MSDQLALDVGARQVSVETSTTTFVVSQFAEVAGISREEATAYLEEFAAEGICERCLGGWTLTPKGRAIACDLAFAAPEEEFGS